MSASIEQSGTATLKTTMLVSILTLVGVVASLFLLLNAIDDIDREPPYFRRLRLLNESKSALKNIKVFVKKTANGPLEDVTGTLQPPPPAQFVEGKVWAPTDTSTTSAVHAVKITCTIGSTATSLEVPGIEGATDAEVVAIVDKNNTLHIHVGFKVNNGEGKVVWAPK